MRDRTPDTRPGPQELDPLQRAARQIRPVSTATRREAAPAAAGGGWWIPLVMLCGVGLGGALIFLRPEGLFVWFAVGSVLVIVGWVGISALFPATADRKCPACGEDALVRLDPDTHRGLACSACAWTDESASSFFLAEEEGALEEVVLRERARLARREQRT